MSHKRFAVLLPKLPIIMTIRTVLLKQLQNILPAITWNIPLSTVLTVCHFLHLAALPTTPQKHEPLHCLVEQRKLGMGRFVFLVKYCVNYDTDKVIRGQTITIKERTKIAENSTHVQRTFTVTHACLLAAHTSTVPMQFKHLNLQIVLLNIRVRSTHEKAERPFVINEQRNGKAICLQACPNQWLYFG